MMYELIKRLVKFHGFTPCESMLQSERLESAGAYSRTWQKEVDVVWEGKQTETYRVVVEALKDMPKAIDVYFIRNGVIEKSRRYESGYGRAYNAIAATIEYAGYSLEVA